jgi:hypothetical protein
LKLFRNATLQFMPGEAWVTDASKLQGLCKFAKELSFLRAIQGAKVRAELIQGIGSSAGQ